MGARLAHGAAVVLALMVMAGCTSTPPPRAPARAGAEPSAPPPPVKEEVPAPSPRTEYPYRAINSDCNCEEFKLADSAADVTYVFRARYKMDTGVVTTIELEMKNSSADTIFFSHGTVRVSSINIAYQYNNKFLPLGELVIPPGDSRGIALTGRDVNEANDWNKIAGERLTVTLRGIRAGFKELRQQSVTFVPENPMLGR